MSKSKKAAVPAEAAGENLSPEADQFLASAMEEFNARQKAMREEWRFDSYKQWGFEQLSGTFRIEYEDGKQLLADGQILGSYSASGNSWEWGWHNPYVDPAIARDSKLVKEAGERLGLAYVTTGMVPVPNEEFVSFLCAIGLKASNSIGVFRGSAGPIDVMILLKNPRIVEKAAKASRKKAA
jgi:hypothetical protein